MGVAIVPPPVLQKQQSTSDDYDRDPSAFPVPSLILDDIIRDNNIRSYSFRLKGRPLTRNAILNQEALCLYETVCVDEDEWKPSCSRSSHLLGTGSTRHVEGERRQYP